MRLQDSFLDQKGYHNSEEAEKIPSILTETEIKFDSSEKFPDRYMIAQEEVAHIRTRGE